MTQIEFLEAPREEIWGNESLKFFLRSDFPNSFKGIGSWVSMFLEDGITEEKLWQQIGKSRFVTFEEYASKLNKTLQVTDEELTGILQTLSTLAQEGNEAIQEKNVTELKRILSKYNEVMTQLFPDFNDSHVIMDAEIVR